MSDPKMKRYLTAYYIVMGVFVLGTLVAAIVGGTETVVLIYLWFFIVMQAFTVLRGVAVFWTDYACSLTNKVVYAAFAIVSAAIYIRIGFYFLELLSSEVYDGMTMLIATSVLATIEGGLLLVAKKFLLNVPFPSFNEAHTDRNEDDKSSS